MPKRYARKSPSKESARIASSDTLNALEQKVMAIAEQLRRIAATAQKNTDAGLNQPAFQSQLAEIRTRTSKLIARLRLDSPSGDGDRRRARERSRKKVAAPGKKHRKAPEAAHGVKHSDELISKELTTRRRRSGRPREG